MIDYTFPATIGGLIFTGLAYIAYHQPKLARRTLMVFMILGGLAYLIIHKNFSEKKGSVVMDYANHIAPWYAIGYVVLLIFSILVTLYKK